MTFPILGANSAVGGYAIDNSLRFNDDDNAYLSKTLSASPTNQKIVSFSFWAKRGNLGVYSYNLVGNTSAPYVVIGFLNDDTFSFQLNAGSGSTGLITTAKYRDTSAWYHMLCVLDTTQATSSNRLKIYINGIQITDFGTANYPAQDSTWNINTNVEHGIGGSSAIQDFDGYMAEVHFIDGQALSPTDFGEFDEDSGIWKPISYSGSYGTNGFYLDFENSGSLGADQSGNGNNFTPTNLASTDQTTDTPTNNFATLNSLHRYTGRFSEGNLKLNGVEKTGTPVELQTSTLGATSGKWYWEVKFEWTGSLASTSARIGIGTELSVPPNPNSSTDEGSVVMIQANKGATLSFRNLNSSPTTNTTGFNTLDPDDIFMFALDIDNKKLFIGKNGTWYNSADPVAGTNAQAYSWTFSNGDITFPVIAFYSGDTASNTYNHTLLPNFGNPAFSISSGNSDDNGYGNFEYEVPTGYLSLCSANLATALSPTIDDGSQYFNTVLYSGDDVDGRTVTGVGFNPDWTWIKRRSASADHMVADTSRGTNANLHTNATNAEFNPITDKQGGGIGSLTTDGFILEQGISSMNNVNDTGSTYVAWNWLANGGTTSSNTDGSITSTVQANTTAGFSVVTFTGTSSNQTVGHGLNQAPEIFFVKSRASSANWNTYTSVIDGSLDYLFLNTTDASGNASNSLPTSSVIYQNNTDSSVAYCFHSVEGYSKIGKYTGNGNTDGPFVYTGFKPAWLMIKNAEQNGGQWFIHDNKRETFNPSNSSLFAESSQAETANNSALDIDFLSNGWKKRNTGSGANNDGITYIYMAFAENPFVDSNGVPVTAR